MGNAVWYLARQGKSTGPFTDAEVLEQLRCGKASPEDLAYGPGTPTWTPVRHLPPFAESGRAEAPPPLPLRRGAADEIDYRIHGEDLQFVEIELDPGESAVAEAGALMYMSEGIEMTTVFGDGSGQDGGFMGKLLGAGKRLITGESLFITVFTNQGRGKQGVAFGAPFPGRIVPMDLAQLGGTLVCQKDSFLCAAKGVSIGIAFQKRIGVGLFGGEGLFFATLKGPGKVWLQSLPLSRLAGRIWAAAPQTGGRRRGEGSLLDLAGGLGNLIDGD